MSAALPQNSEEWGSLLQYIAGGVLGSLWRPWMWVALPLPSYIAVLVATASQESAFDKDASGDTGNSIGIAQFNIVNAGIVGPAGDDMSWRSDPFTSGLASAQYVSQALWSSPTWWLICLPWYTLPFARYMWTHGTSSEDASAAFNGEAAALVQTEHEWRGSAAFWPWFWGAWLTVGPALFFAGRAAWQRLRS